MFIRINTNNNSNLKTEIVNMENQEPEKKWDTWSARMTPEQKAQISEFQKESNLTQAEFLIAAMNALRNQKTADDGGKPAEIQQIQRQFGQTLALVEAFIIQSKNKADLAATDLDGQKEQAAALKSQLFEAGKETENLKKELDKLEYEKSKLQKEIEEKEAVRLVWEDLRVKTKEQEQQIRDMQKAAETFENKLQTAIDAEKRTAQEQNKKLLQLLDKKEEENKTAVEAERARAEKQIEKLQQALETKEKDGKAAVEAERQRIENWAQAQIEKLQQAIENEREKAAAAVKEKDTEIKTAVENERKYAKEQMEMLQKMVAPAAAVVPPQPKTAKVAKRKGKAVVEELQITEENEPEV
jgi:hypothetical protein